MVIMEMQILGDFPYLGLKSPMGININCTFATPKFLMFPLEQSTLISNMTGLHTQRGD